MKKMLKNKGIVSFMIFMIGVSYFYSTSLKDSNNIEMVTSEVISAESFNTNEL